MEDKKSKIEILGDYIVVTGVDLSNEKLLLDSYKSIDERIKQMGIKIIDDIFLDKNNDIDLRLKAGKFILENTLGKKGDRQIMNNENDLLNQAMTNLRFFKRENEQYIIETSFTPVGMNTKYCACNIDKDNNINEIETALLEQIRRFVQ